MNALEEPWIDVIGFLAHELASPLGAIQLHSDLMGDIVAPGSELAKGQSADDVEVLRESLTAIAGCLTQVRGLIEKIRFLDDRRAHLDRRPTTPQEVIDETVRRRKTLQPGSTIQLEIDVAPSLAHTKVALDRIQVVEGLYRLIENAVLASEKTGGAPVKVSAQPAIHEGRQAIRFEVTDRGPGIPAEELPRVFQLTYTTKKVGKALGVGLPIALRVARRHGGELTLDSRLGEGTTARMTIPN